jgi:hypothetical protein
MGSEKTHKAYFTVRPTYSLILAEQIIIIIKLQILSRLNFSNTIFKFRIVMFVNACKQYFVHTI